MTEVEQKIWSDDNDVIYGDRRKFCNAGICLSEHKEELDYGANCEGDPMCIYYLEEDDGNFLNGDKCESLVIWKSLLLQGIGM